MKEVGTPACPLPGGRGGRLQAAAARGRQGRQLGTAQCGARLNVCRHPARPAAHLPQLGHRPVQLLGVSGHAFQGARHAAAAAQRRRQVGEHCRGVGAGRAQRAARLLHRLRVFKHGWRPSGWGGCRRVGRGRTAGLVGKAEAAASQQRRRSSLSSGLPAPACSSLSTASALEALHVFCFLTALSTCTRGLGVSGLVRETRPRQRRQWARPEMRGWRHSAQAVALSVRWPPAAFLLHRPARMPYPHGTRLFQCSLYIGGACCCHAAAAAAAAAASARVHALAHPPGVG